MFFRVLTRLQAVEKLTGLEEAGKQIVTRYEDIYLP